MAGIKITLVDDVTSFLRGTQRAEEALDDVADSLDDLARDAQRQGRTTGDDLARGIDRGTDRARDSVDSMEKSFRDLSRGVQRESKQVGDDLGDNIKRGSREASEGLDDLNNNAASNAKEFAASWDGSADGALDSVQGFVAEALEGFGPLGLAGGVALAAAAGAMYTAFSENAAMSEQRIADMYNDMKESGQDFLSGQLIDQQISDIVEGVDGAIRSYDQVKKDAEQVGVSTATMLRAWAGDQGAVTEVLETTRAKQNEILEQFRSGDLAGADYTKAATALTSVTDGLSDAGSETDVARQKVEDYRAAIAGLPENKVTDVEVNTQPGRMGMGDFYRGIEQARPTVRPNVDTSDADREYAAWAARRRTVNVSTVLVTKAV